MAEADPTIKNVLPLTDWDSNRWDGIIRPYSQEDVERLRGTANVQYTLASTGSEKLWNKLKNLPINLE